MIGNYLMAFAIILLTLIGVFSIVRTISSEKRFKDPWIYIVLMVSAIVLPLCFNVTLILSPEVTYHSLMRIHWVFIPILLIAICDGCTKEWKQQTSKVILQWICFISAIILIIQYALVCNIGYFNLEKKYEKTYAYCLRLLDRMEETSGYYHGMPVAMIGVVGDHYLPSTDLTVSVTDSLLNVNGDYLFYTAENYQAFLEYYFGVTIELVDISEMPEIIQSEEYLALDTFPNENAMTVVDGVLYIKTEN